MFDQVHFWCQKTQVLREIIPFKFYLARWFEGSLENDCQIYTLTRLPIELLWAVILYFTSMRICPELLFIRKVLIFCRFCTHPQSGVLRTLIRLRTKPDRNHQFG